MLFNRKIPQPVLTALLKPFAAYHGGRIARSDLKTPAPIDDDCVRVLAWLWRTDRGNAIWLHTWILSRINAVFAASGTGRRARSDYLVPRLAEGVRKLQIAGTAGMPRGLVQHTAR